MIYNKFPFNKSFCLFICFRINVNMKKLVYCTAIAMGDEREWDFGWERFKNSQVASEKDMILNALTCTKKEGLLKR